MAGAAATKWILEYPFPLAFPFQDVPQFFGRIDQQGLWHWDSASSKRRGLKAFVRRHLNSFPRNKELTRRPLCRFPSQEVIELARLTGQFHPQDFGEM